MPDNDPIPTLLQFMFAEKAALAYQGASQRLLLWCAAFDDWLAERKRKYLKNACLTSTNAWKQLLSRLPLAPWEITPADIKSHVQWLEGQGRAPVTIRGVLAGLSGFYAWCDSRRIDPLCAPGFNPAAEVPKPKTKNYAKAQALTPQEARRLLAVLKQDTCSLSRRDYAFFLARLHLGVSLKGLQCLQWGQIRSDAAGAWVDWGSGRPSELLPPAVWLAILDYLEASGRLASMRPAAYIFAPLANALVNESSDKAGDWNDQRCLSNNQIERVLKTYGRLAGIPEEKLTHIALRHTAALLRLEAGDGPEQIQAFLGRSSLQDTRNYLRLLPTPTPPDGTIHPAAEPQPPAEPPLVPTPIRERRPHWSTFTHGRFSKSQPPEQLAAVLAEGVRGLGDEIAGLRWLARLLLELQATAVDHDELEALIEAYGRLASQIGELVKTEKQLARRSTDDDWVGDLLAVMASIAQENGEALDVDAIREDARRGPQLDIAARQLAEEIASLRLVLRRLFSMAQASQDIAKILRLADLAGKTCTRLARLLKVEVAQAGEAQAEQKQIISQALQEVAKELDLE
jgi:integrase